jgi:gluconate kinase
MAPSVAPVRYPARMCVQQIMMQKTFLLISGLPASGKTTLAYKLSSVFGLSVIDKDEILDHLFESKGVGDTSWRRKLSRESDLILQQKAAASGGAILSSFWHAPGMPADSGTPTDWIDPLSHHVVTIHCECDITTAVERFLQRKRHQGHLDGNSSYEQLVADFEQLDRLKPIVIGERVIVNTSAETNLELVVQQIQKHLHTQT